MRTILLFILLLFAQQAAAATIEVVPQTGEEPALIVVQGTLQLDDIDNFRTKASEVTKAVVAFRSAWRRTSLRHADRKIYPPTQLGNRCS